MEVSLSSKRENPHEAAGSVIVTEVAILETSTPFLARGNALAPVISEDANGATSSSTGPTEEIARVARVLMDWSSNVSA